MSIVDARFAQQIVLAQPRCTIREDYPILVWCWSASYDSGPPRYWNWESFSCLLWGIPWIPCSSLDTWSAWKTIVGQLLRNVAPVYIQCKWIVGHNSAVLGCITTSDNEAELRQNAASILYLDYILKMQLFFTLLKRRMYFANKVCVILQPAMMALCTIISIINLPFCIMKYIYHQHTFPAGIYIYFSTDIDLYE